MFEMKMSESNEIASTWFDVNESTECFDAIELLYYSHSSAPEHQYTQYSKTNRMMRTTAAAAPADAAAAATKKHRKFTVCE